MTPPMDESGRAVEPTFHFEWGGSADLSAAEIWPDGDAPENPTVADVMGAMQKSGRGGGPRYVCREWNLDIEEIQVSGPGGRQLLTDQGVRVIGQRIPPPDPRAAETKRFGF